MNIKHIIKISTFATFQQPYPKNASETMFLNNCFINAVENVTSKAPISLGDSFNQQNGTRNIKNRLKI